jgi:ESS family glutamate:Na+ symporter
MISGIVIGMVLVNWAYSRGYIKTVRPFHKRTLHERRGIHAQTERPSAGKQTVLADSVDSLAWHIAIIGIAVLIGYGILEGLQKLEIACFPDYKTRLFAGFPLFPLCMLGGVILQIVTKFIKVDLLVDRAQMDRISGAALDYLALAAVATINVAVVAQNWLPLLIMCVAGLVWTVFSVLFFSPRLFKEAWFERGIAEFGQACGVTATGLMLLRTVDPENRTPAAMSFGYKQLLHEPIMGGGIWTAMAFTLVYRIGWLNVWIISTVMLAIWCTMAFFLARNRRIAAGR